MVVDVSIGKSRANLGKVHYHIRSKYFLFHFPKINNDSTTYVSNASEMYKLPTTHKWRAWQDVSTFSSFANAQEASTYFGFFIERFFPPSDRLVLSHKRKLRVNILRIIFAMVSGDTRPSMCPFGAKRMPFCVVGSMRHE